MSEFKTMCVFGDGVGGRIAIFTVRPVNRKTPRRCLRASGVVTEPPAYCFLYPDPPASEDGLV